MLSIRSLCSLVCKWTYEIRDNGSEGWNRSYFQQIGLEDLLENNSEKIGNTVLTPGTHLASGLSESASEELGLPPGTPVGASIIDAHAGGLGLIGCSAQNISNDFNTRLGNENILKIVKLYRYITACLCSTNLRYFNMPHGCFKGSSVRSWNMGSLL